MKKYNRNFKVTKDKKSTLSLLRHDNRLDEITEMKQALKHFDFKIARNTQ
jgi:hypothetical protein